MRKILFPMLGVIFLSSLFAGEITKSVKFSPNDVNIYKYEGYDVIKLTGSMNTQKVGAPLLPCKGISVLIPSNAKIVSVKVIDYKQEEIPGKYNIYPAQPPQPISYKIKSAFVPPDKKIYSSLNEYPEKIIELTHTGSISGYKIANLLIYPIHYVPAQKSLIIYTDIVFKITYKEGISKYIPRIKKSLIEPQLKKLIINPEDINIFAPRRDKSKFSSLLPPDTVDYVIITSSAFDTVFQRLADWKTKKGVPAKVIIVDSIYTNYSGRDNPEKVRNFIIDANATWGTIYFLLAGQCDFENGQEVVPRRDVYYITSGAGYYPDEDTIPSDLYFSDLDGTWNNDNDGVWGEAPANGDTVDLYSDVFVGRAPCYTISQAQTFVNKVLTYERTPYLGYQKRLFLPAGILWSGYEGDTIVQNAIANMAPGDWEKAKLYEKLGNLSEAAAVDSMNVGFALGHFVGHGNEYGVYYSYGPYLNSNDADALSNMPKIGIYNSIGCFTGALDEVPGGDCFAEHLVNNPNGGVVASIMNTRYGWGFPPSLGPSEIIDTTFFDEIFRENNYKLGIAHAFAKDAVVPYVSWSSVWAWCIYELNLWGDPEMDIYTDVPDTFEVVHDNVIPIGATSFNVSVTSGGVAVDSAYICLYKPNEVYSRGYTDASGNATLNITSPTSLGTLYVTVTKHNYVPKESYAMVISANGGYVVYDSYSIDDDTIGQSNGNGDSIVNPGETIELPVTVHNVGLDTAFNVYGIISSSDTFVTIISDSAYFGDTLLPDSLYLGLQNYVFRVDTNCPKNHTIPFNLTVHDINDSIWISSFSILATFTPPNITVSPDTLEKFLLVDTMGYDTLWIKNSGGDTLTFSIEEIDTALSLLGIIPSQRKARIDRIKSPKPLQGNIHRGQKGHKVHSVVKPYIAPFGAVFTDTIFFDDMEGGINGWTTVDYSGGGDLWHQITSHLYVSPSYHSPTHSWWCGIDAQGNYDNGNVITNGLISPPIYIPLDCSLATLDFWEYYNTEPGYDLVNVYISNDGGTTWASLRSGITGSSGGWKETSFDISSYKGDSIMIRFYFNTQDSWFNDYYGWFIDDVGVTITTTNLIKWLSENVKTGNVPPGDSMGILLTYNSTGLKSDTTYTGMLKISHNDTDTTAINIPVFLHIIAPHIALNKDSISVAVSPGDTLIDSLIIKNTGTYWLKFLIQEAASVPKSKGIDTVFYDNMENGEDGWSYYGLWHQTNHRFSSDSTSWYYGIEGVWNYNTGGANRGALVSPPIDLTTAGAATLTFSHYLDCEGSPYEHGIVQVSPDNGGTWYTVFEKNSTSGQWQDENIDISQWINNKSVKIKFFFDTQDDQNNDFEGWYIDNVMVTATPYNVEWLSVSPVEDSIYEGDSLFVLLQFDAAGLKSDTTYTGALVISHNDHSKSKIYIPVVLNTGEAGINKFSQAKGLIPHVFSLSTPFPNPFRDNVVIRYGIPKKSNVKIMVYDITGRVLKVFNEGERSPGYYTVKWRGDSRNGKLSSGIYFIRLIADKNVINTRKIILIR